MTDFLTAMQEHFSYGDMEKNANMFTEPVISPSDPGDASVGANILRTATPLNLGLTLAGGVGGGLLMRNRAKRTKPRPGETEEERRARINRAAIKGGLLGAAVPAGLTGVATFMGNVQPDYGMGLSEGLSRLGIIGAGGLAGRGIYRGAIGSVADQRALFQQRALALYNAATSKTPTRGRAIQSADDFLRNPAQWYNDIVANRTNLNSSNPAIISELRNAGLVDARGRVIVNESQMPKWRRAVRTITGAPKTLKEHLAGLQRYAGVDQPIGPNTRHRFNPYRRMPRPAGGMVGRSNPRGRAAALIAGLTAGGYLGNKALTSAANQWSLFED